MESTYTAPAGSSIDSAMVGAFISLIFKANMAIECNVALRLKLLRPQFFPPDIMAHMHAVAVELLQM